MSYTWAKVNCTDAEMRRFAACFLNCKDMQNAVDWEAAAAQFDPKVKVASFRTVTARAVKKVQEGAGTTPVTTGSDAGEKKPAVKGKGKTGSDAGGKKTAAKGEGKKRKAAGEEEVVASEEDEKPAKKAKGGKGKKAKAESEDAGEEIAVKGEGEEE